jgi:hypothetical protein
MARRIKGLLAAAACCAALTNAAFAGVIVSHSGATDPTTESFSQVGGTWSPVTNDLGLGISAVNVQGTWDSGQMTHGFTGTEQTELTSGDWVLSADFRDLSTATTPTYAQWPYSYGDWVSILFNGVRFDIGLSSDGAGDQFLLTNLFASTPAYTITGLGQSYALVQLDYNATIGKADYYVNGVKVLSGVAGTSTPWSPQLAFGGQNGNFNLVQLRTGDLTTTPEPASWLGAGAGLLALLALAGFRADRGARVSRGL